MFNNCIFDYAGGQTWANTPYTQFNKVNLYSDRTNIEVFFKKYIRKFSNKNTPLTFKVFEFKFVLQIYADEIKADYDKSKLLTAKEAFYLSVALSLDSLAVGFSSGLVYVNYILLLILKYCIKYSSF